MSAIEASKAAAGLAVAIVGVPSVNAAIGFDPEARARRSLIRLRNLTVPRAVVRRDEQTISPPRRCGRESLGMAPAASDRYVDPLDVADEL